MFIPDRDIELLKKCVDLYVEQRRNPEKGELTIGGAIMFFKDAADYLEREMLRTRISDLHL
jgi:hypothetical protein